MRTVIGILIGLTLLGLTSCGKKEKPEHSGSGVQTELLIWINGDKPYEALQEIGKTFTDETGVKVRVEHPVGMENTFGQAAVAGNGPDIVMWAHDRLGGWAKSGLIDPLNISDSYKATIHQKGWDAFTYGGKIWGYPVSMEAISLIYNKALIKEADLPKTLGDVKKEDLLWAYDTPYFTWPFLAGDGGYIYARDASGTYDITDIGVNTPGAVTALQGISDLIDKGILPRGMTYDVMANKMTNGECAMMISGPWAWPDLEKAGIDFGIATIPGVKNPVRPLVGILGAMINSKSTNKEIAELFIKEYMITDDGLLKMANQKFGGPVALKTANAKQLADPKIAKSMENVELGVLMPNIPEMGVFWSSVEAAFKTVTAGQSDAQKALDNAATIMKTENNK